MFLGCRVYMRLLSIISVDKIDGYHSLQDVIASLYHSSLSYSCPHVIEASVVYRSIYCIPYKL